MTPTFPPDFDRRLRAVMGYKDVTPNALAAVLGVTTTFVRRMRLGEKTPGPDKAQKLAAMFPEGITDYLFGFTNILPGWRP